MVKGLLQTLEGLHITDNPVYHSGHAITRSENYAMIVVSPSGESTTVRDKAWVRVCELTVALVTGKPAHTTCQYCRTPCEKLTCPRCKAIRKAYSDENRER